MILLHLLHENPKKYRRIYSRCKRHAGMTYQQAVDAEENEQHRLIQAKAYGDGYRAGYANGHRDAMRGIPNGLMVGQCRQ